MSSSDSDDSNDSDDSEESKEDFTFKPLRKSMIYLYECLTTTLESLQKIQAEVSKPSVQTYLDSLYPLLLEKKVRGIDVYDFIRESIVHTPPIEDKS